jgi:hypothetical protein
MLTLYNSQLEDLQIELLEVEEEMADISEQLGPYANDGNLCGKEETCGDCAAHTTCVWCYTSGLCAAGDADGALDRTCAKFDYSECRDNQCSLYTGCDACTGDLDCIWCSNGNFCSNGTSTTCSETFTYTAETDCPTDPNSDSGEVDESLSDDEIEQLQAELSVL